MKTYSRPPFRSPVVLSLSAALILASRAQAQITVTTAADENDFPAGAQISLREALRDSAGGGQITFAPALSGKVLVLTAGEMVVTGKTVTVNAADGFVIEGRGLSRLFRVEAGAGLNLTKLTLQGGTSAGNGGAILNAGTLSLTDCLLRENSAATGTTGTAGQPGYPVGGAGGAGGNGGNGGAISSTGTLTALRCRFIANGAGRGGTGGTGGPANPINSGFEDGGPGGVGGAGGNGGAIQNSGPLQLTECIFEENWSGPGGLGGTLGYPGGNVPNSDGGNGGNGGAVHQTGDMTVQRCTFSKNTAHAGGFPTINTHPFYINFNHGGIGGSGAAVYLSSGSATITNCTVTGNNVGESGRQVEYGGSVAAGEGTQLKLVHCTVSENSFRREYSTGSPYPVWYDPSTAGIFSATVVQCQNCIVSGNTVSLAEGNFSPNTVHSDIPFGSTGGTPLLSALSLTAGSLPVLVPDSTSPALNAGANLSGAPATDERGLPRGVGAPDLGAVEVQPSEPARLALQSISFSPPSFAETVSVSLNAFAPGGPVSLELVSGPATLVENTLTFTGPGFAAVRASQAGNATTAPAVSIVRVIEAPHSILFTPAQNYVIFPQSETVVTLPAVTSAGLPVTWSFVGTPGAGATLTDNKITATSPGTVEIRGQNGGNSQYPPVTTTWTLTFIPGLVWWETPTAPAGGPAWFTLVEGSPHGVTMTATITAPHNVPVTVPPLPGGLIATPAAVPPGQTSVQCQITLPANAQLTNQTQILATGNPATTNITFFLANRTNVPLDIFPPPRVLAGVPTLVDISIPGVPAGQTYGPPPDLSVRTVTVTAADFDNAAIPVPVTVDSVTPGSGAYPGKRLKIIFPSVNRRVRLTVTTDDGITGQAGPVQIYAPPPITIEQEGTSFRAVLSSRPRDLQGWSYILETSIDLQTWTPASASSTTVTANPDGTSDRISVLLPAGPGKQFIRLKAATP